MNATKDWSPPDIRFWWFRLRAGLVDRIQRTELIENQMTEKMTKREMTQNPKNHKTVSTVLILIFGPIYI